MRITGEVQPNGDPVISVRLRGAGGKIATVDAIVDTAFNNEIALPASVVDSLGLTPMDTTLYTLADGSVSMQQQYAVDVELFGMWRQMLAVCMEGGPLGMEFFGGCHLGIDAIPGGTIEIVPLR